MNAAHAGVGSITYTTCLLLHSLLGVQPTFVPFNGAAPAMNALLGGQVDYICNAIPDSIQHVQSGTAKGYAISTAERSPALPKVPTSKEAGLPEFDASAWNALFAPKGTPKAVLDKLTDALDKALDDESVRKRLLDLGCDIPTNQSVAHNRLLLWSRARSRAGRRSSRQHASRPTNSRSSSDIP